MKYWADGHTAYSSVRNPVVRLRWKERAGANGERILFIEEMQPPNKVNQEKMPSNLRNKWREIGMHYATRHALDHGFDHVAWTTGQMQADRYNLSKAVQKVIINADRTEADKVDVIAVYKDRGLGSGYIGKFDRGKLPSAIGRDAAAKLDSRPWEQRPQGGVTKSLEGEGLNVGGEGLRRLYDEDLGNVAKKFGAKPGTIKLHIPPKKAIEDIGEQTGQTADNLSQEDFGHDVAGFDLAPFREEDALDYSADLRVLDSYEHPKQSRKEILRDIEVREDLSGVRRDMARSSRSGASLLGLGITPGVQKGEWIDIRGKRVRDIKDVVAIGRLFRSPQVETFHVIYIKDGHVVAHEAISSRLPNLSLISTSPGYQGLEKIGQRVKRLDADQVYFLHNHPSGEVTTSPEDRFFTKVICRKVPQARGQIIINHKIYSFIDNKGKAAENLFLPNRAPDLIHKASVPHLGLGQQISHPDQLAAWGKAFVQPSPENVTVIYRSKAKVRAIENVPRKLFMNAKEFPNWVRGRARGYGGSDMFVYYNNPTSRTRSLEVWGQMLHYVETATILDGYAEELPHASEKAGTIARGKYHGLTHEQLKKATIRMREDPVPYGEREEGDSKEPAPSEIEAELNRRYSRIVAMNKADRRTWKGVLASLYDDETPGAWQKPLYWIRSADQVLAKHPKTAPVEKAIKTAAREKKGEMQQYNDLATEIIGEAGIRKNSEEDNMVRDLLDEAFTGLTPEKLQMDRAYQGNREAAIRAAGRLRNEVFEPIINDIRSDQKLIDIIGKRGYIRGYFPHYWEQMKTKYGERDAAVIARQVLPERFVSRFLKERESNQWLNNVSIFDVVPSYIQSTMRTKHDIPAYNEALKTIETLPEDSPIREFADWYVKNYIGINTNKYMGLIPRDHPIVKLSRWIANRHYDATIGLNLKTWGVNTLQTLSNTVPELGFRYTGIGIKELSTKEGRRKFHDSGLLFDFPGIESGILAEGTYRKVMHYGMAKAEYLNRGIAYLGGLEQARDMGLVGKAAEMHAMDIVEKTQFTYSKESAIPALDALTPDAKVLMTFPLKEAEFFSGLVKDAYHGGAHEKAKLVRFLLINFGLAAAAKAAGIQIKDWLIDLMDMVPGIPRSWQLLNDLRRYLWRLSDGQIKPKNIPKDILEGLYRAFGPGAVSLRRLARQTGIIEDNRRKKAS